MRSAFLKCFLLLSTMALTHCADPKDSESSGYNPRQVSDNWSPEDVSYTCADDSKCPDNQGVLLSRSTSLDFQLPLYQPVLRTLSYRCTATAYEAKKILTAGHCVEDMRGADQIWFRTVAKPGRPSHSYRVKGELAYKLSETPLTHVDYGAFELEEAVVGVTYAHPLQTMQSEPKEMLALVSNPVGEDENHQRLDAVNCHYAPSFVNLTEYLSNPLFFFVQDCKIYSGNSGGVLVEAADLTSVVGVVDTSTNAKNDSNLDLYKQILYSLSPHPKANLPHIDIAGATNARCFALPGWPQVQSPCKDYTQKDITQQSGLRVGEMLAQKILEVATDLRKDLSEGHLGSTLTLRYEMEPASFKPDFYVSDVPTQVVIVPVVRCFEGSSDRGTLWGPVNAKNYTPKIASVNSIGLERQPDDLAAQLNVRKNSDGDFVAMYNWYSSGDLKPFPGGKLSLINNARDGWVIPACDSVADTSDADLQKSSEFMGKLLGSQMTTWFSE